MPSREPREPLDRPPPPDEPLRGSRDPAPDPFAPPPSPRAEGDWRDSVATASGLNVLAGIWLIIAPFVLGYGDGDPIWNDVVFGAIVAVLALVRVSGAYRASWLSWINAAIGVWIFVSAFWLDDTGTARTNDVILGIVVFILALLSAGASDAARWYRR